MADITAPELVLHPEDIEFARRSTQLSALRRELDDILRTQENMDVRINLFNKKIAILEQKWMN